MADSSETPKNGVAVYKRLLCQVKTYWPLFIVVALGNVIYSGVDSYSTYLFKPLLDKGFFGADKHFLHILPFIVLGLFFLRSTSGFISTYVMGWISRRVVYRFRKDMFTHLLTLPARYYDDTTSGQLLAKITYNVEQLAQCNSDALTVIVRQSCLVIGLLTVMFMSSWKLTLLIFIIFPFLILVVRYATKRFRLLSKRIQKGMGNITQSAEETISGYKEVRIFAGQEYQRKEFFGLLDYNFKQEMKVILTDAANTPAVQFLGAIVLSAVIYIAFHGFVHVSAGSFVSLFSAMILILNPIKALTKVNATIQRGIAAAESIYELVDHPEEEDFGKGEIERVTGDIQFKNVCFQYPETEAQILNHIDLTVEAGQTCALVGRSGGGKSTLVALLARFYSPTSGTVEFDSENIQDLTLKNVRSHISIVSQHVNLFDDTLRHNIAYGDLEGATDEKIIEAAKAAYAWEFIAALPEGLDTHIGENGLKLSGGQRQRIAIARAILKNAPILILDEATSALDNESEKAVQKAMDNLRKNRTTIVIAHRLSTIEDADKIVVLDHGNILESGTHTELLAKEGTYAKLYHSATL